VTAGALWGVGGPFLCWGELERVAGGREAVGTLLGPERTGMGGAVASLVFVCLFRAGLLSNRFQGFLGVGGGVGLVCGLLFENCTVDASIFVAKFLRAHGGCLGTRSR
jgi:hypothetical protein